MLNTVHAKPAHIANFLVLVAKQHIFAVKCLCKEMNFRNIVTTFEDLYRSEMYNMHDSHPVRQNRILEKWSPNSGIVNNSQPNHVSSQHADYETEYIMRM